MERLRSDLERVTQQVLSLRTEVTRLTQENQDLQESAKIWIRLYEIHLARADHAVTELAMLRRDRGANRRPTTQ
jgi:hypothetical protein